VPEIIRAKATPLKKRRARRFLDVLSVGKGPWQCMLFLRGPDCPTQYFDCVNQLGGGEKEAAFSAIGDFDETARSWLVTYASRFRGCGSRHTRSYRDKNGFVSNRRTCREGGDP